MFSAMPRMRGLQILNSMRRPDITSAYHQRKRTCALHSTMSALGQKRTCAMQNVMSALPQKRTSVLDSMTGINRRQK